jgi:hypothetical protein
MQVVKPSEDRNIGPAHPPEPLPEAICGQIRAHLKEILQSEAFTGSRRSQEFLRYVVEETLAGRGAAIKERNIALDVFGRSRDFDSQKESIVRVKAVEVRRRLAHAYKNGAPGTVRIELPAGAYQPVFRLTAPAPTAAPGEPATNRSRARGWTAIFFVLLAAAIIVFIFLVHHRGPLPGRSPMDQLWDPFALQDRPVLISLPAPTVLELEHQDIWLPLRPGESIPAKELLPRNNYYTGVGAAMGAARFAEQLALRNQAFNVKFGTDVTFADLKQSPALLLGAFTSVWSIEMTRQLRFNFAADGAARRIVDTFPGGRIWQEINRSSPPTPNADGYALITRILSSDAGHPILMAAGISALGTQAAVEFLTHEPYFDSFARIAPPDWTRKNFQAVIRSRIHGHSTGRPDLVAWYVW